MSMMINDHFKHRLVTLGYPDDLQIEFSLGHCQGDGVAFYGKIGNEAAERLMKRLLNPERDAINSVDRVKNLMAYKHIEPMMRVIRECSEVGLEIAKNDFGNHYSHFNTMSLCDDSEPMDHFLDDEEITDLEVSTGIKGLGKDTLATWGAIWLRFCQALKEDIVETSRTLEQEGYKLIEAVSSEEEVVWEFRTENYIARLSEMPCEHFDMGWDEEVIHDTAQSMIDGEERVVGLKAEVLDRETETVLGEDSLYGIVYAIGDRSYGGFRSELVINAVDSARGFINRLKVKVA